MAKMILKEVFINKYKSYSEEHKVCIDQKVTTLVGKNESGKTAFLEAVAKSNYFEEDDNFVLNTTLDYPRKELSKYKKSSDTQYCVKTKYIICDELLDLVAEDLGSDVLLSKEFEYTLNYDQNASVTIPKVNTKAYLDNLYKEYKVSSKEVSLLSGINTIKDLLEFEIEEDDSEEDFILPKIKEHINTCIIPVAISSWNDILGSYIYSKHIKVNIPKFWYYDEYYELPSRININHLKGNNISGNLTPETLKTSKALFDMAGIDIEELINADSFESFLAELEATSNSITDDIFEYWSTNNDDLEIKFEIETIANGIKELEIRVRNSKHRVTLPLRSRSKGFNWFFSFIIWFSKIQSQDNNFIILLDEPGLNLHATAQNDLLRFLEDLSMDYQIIYTTHSPFMIDSEKLDRVRTVFDTSTGTRISETIQEKDPDTLFPLQAALGYDIAQNLFISKNNLLVEGPADLLILSSISAYLESINRVSLNDDITIVPVGGLDKVSSFISLLRGSKLKIVCLLDSFESQKGKQKLDNMVKSKIIKGKNILFFDQFTDYDKSDIEDIFTKEEYLNLFNSSFDEYEDIDVETIEDKPILKQINIIIEKNRFNHYRPAKELISSKDLGEFLSERSLDRFEDIFDQINRLLL